MLGGTLDVKLECAYSVGLNFVNSRRTHIVIPEQLVSEIDKLVGKRGRSQFLVESAQKELQRLRMLKALQKATGSWQDGDHPELKAGAAAWVSALRKGEEELAIHPFKKPHYK